MDDSVTPRSSPKGSNKQAFNEPCSSGILLRASSPTTLLRSMLRHGGATAPLTISDRRARHSLGHDLDPATTEWQLEK
jgi:hypothetical protein